MADYTKAELVGFMSAYDNDELPDGAWFAVLEQGGDAFISHKKLDAETIDGNDIAHEYLREIGHS